RSPCIECRREGRQRKAQRAAFLRHQPARPDQREPAGNGAGGGKKSAAIESCGHDPDLLAGMAAALQPLIIFLLRVSRLFCRDLTFRTGSGAFFGAAIAAAAGGDDLQPFSGAQFTLPAIESRGVGAGRETPVTARSSAQKAP